MNGNNLSHIAPRNAVLQPVVQFRTAIHSHSLTGGTSYRVYKLWHFGDLLSVPIPWVHPDPMEPTATSASNGLAVAVVLRQSVE